MNENVVKVNNPALSRLVDEQIVKMDLAKQRVAIATEATGSKLVGLAAGFKDYLVARRTASELVMCDQESQLGEATVNLGLQDVGR